jgi:hypothetical protein
MSMKSFSHLYENEIFKLEGKEYGESVNLAAIPEAALEAKDPDWQNAIQSLVWLKNDFKFSKEHIHMLVSCLSKRLPNAKLIVQEHKGLDIKPDTEYVTLSTSTDTIVLYTSKYNEICINYSISNGGTRGSIDLRKNQIPYDLILGLFDIFDKSIATVYMPNKQLDNAISANSQIIASAKDIVFDKYVYTSMFLAKQGSKSGLRNNIIISVLRKGNKVMHIYAFGAGLYSAKSNYSGNSYKGLKTWLDTEGFNHIGINQ